jgi:hypothetical protein
MRFLKPSTPVGAGATGAAIANVLLYLLSLWHAYAAVPTSVKASIQTIVTALVVYLAGWFNVTRQPNQEATVTLTPSLLPTVKLAAEEAAAPAGSAGGG